MTKKEEQKKLSRVKRMYEKERKTIREVADSLGIGINTAYRLLIASGAKMRPKGSKSRLWTKREISVLRKLLKKKGVRQREVVAEFQCDIGTAKRAALENDIKWPWS